MFTSLKDKKFVLVAVIAFLAMFPFILNWLLLRDAILPVVGDSTTWLTFWPVYLSAIASFSMIYMTYLSLKQSREHMEDLKKREAEEQRARLVFSIIVYQAAFYLRIFNIGKENAFNVKLNINNDFIEEIKESYRQYYYQLSNPDFIEAGKSIYILIGWCEDVNKAWERKDIVLRVNGSYNDKYEVDDTLDMRYFIGKTHFMVRGDLETTMEYIKKGLIVQNNAYKPVQKSLDEIAHSLVRIDYSLMELSRQMDKSSNDGEEEGKNVLQGEDDIEMMAEESPDNIPVLRD